MYPGTPTSFAPFRLDPLKRFDPRRVDRHQFRQVELERSGLTTGTEQLRDLFDAEPAGQPNNPPLVLVFHADPAVHANPMKAKPAPSEAPKNDKEPAAYGLDDTPG